MTRPERLADLVVDQWMTTHPTWRREGAHLVRTLRTVDYPSGVRLVTAQVAIAEGLNHHPVIRVGYAELTIELWTHDQGGLTQLDLEYAEAFDNLVASAFADTVLG